VFRDPLAFWHCLKALQEKLFTVNCLVLALVLFLISALLTLPVAVPASFAK
jgi:hypothetical protein